MGHYAAPIRRSLIEHAVCLAGVAEQPQSFESFIRALQRETAKHKAAAQRIGLELEGTDAVMAWETSDDTKQHDRKMAFKHRCEDLGDIGDRLYVQWLEESMLSHAGFATATMYLRNSAENDDAPTLMRDPQYSSNDWLADATCADLLILALDAFSRMVDGDPLSSDVRLLNEDKDRLLEEARVLSGTKGRATNSWIE